MEARLLVATLRLIHILGGIFWVGGAMVNTLFLLPSVRAVGPSAAPLLQFMMQKRRLPVWMNVAMALTILSGFWLYGFFASAGGGWARSRMAMVLGLGALFALGAAGVGGALIQPTTRRLAALGQQAQSAGGPPSGATQEEMKGLQARLARGLSVVLTLLVLAAAAMAVARYV
jgi:uncharacterized membrane protein